MKKNKGWRNESRRHGLSAKGIKTAQKIPFKPAPMKDQELAKVIRNLDPLEERLFQQQLFNGQKPEKALEVVVNSVEGDKSQLSPELMKYAQKKGWFKGFEQHDKKVDVRIPIKALDKNIKNVVSRVDGSLEIYVKKINPLTKNKVVRHLIKKDLFNKFTKIDFIEI